MPFNITAHEFLTANGYSHCHYDSEIYDGGNGESGPRIVYSPSYDEYTSDFDRIIIDEDGKAHQEIRDLEFEDWVEEQITSINNF